MSNNYIIVSIVILGITMFIYNRYYRNRQKKQLIFIKSYHFPNRIILRVNEIYPHLSEEELNKVIYALRDYFFIANQANNKIVAMPSKVVDIAWHEFLLFTKEYQDFSNKAFGKFFHHIPAEPIVNKDTVDDSLKLIWKLACLKENILPSSPDKLPLLFVIDKLLKIEDGNIYTLGNNLTNTLASHRYGYGGASEGGSCSGHSSCGGGGCSGG